MRGMTINLRKSVNLALSLMSVLSLTNIEGVPAFAHRHDASLLSMQSGSRVSKQTNFSGEGSGVLTGISQSGKQLGKCPLKHTDVRASVSGYVARVSVKQNFENNFKEKIEAVYTFPLPENAAVDEMTMRIGDRVIKGDIKKREEAREIYEQARAQGHVASILDEERPNIFTQSVANIEPGARVEIEIKYVNTLPYEAGAYSFNFPTVVGPRFVPGSSVGHSGKGRLPDTDAVPDASKITPKIAPAGERSGHDISIAVDIDAGVPIRTVKSQLHEVSTKGSGNRTHVELVDRNTIPNKDFVLNWEVAAENIQSGCLTYHDDKSGYFSLMLLPPKRVQPDEISPKEMVFLIDCSGSQSGPPLEKAKETLSYIVNHMNRNDTFQIIAFNDRQAQFAERPQLASPEMKKSAEQFIQKLQANGGTWMGPAVERVCGMGNDEHRLRIVTFMTDGYVGNDMEILGMIKKYRDKSRWFSFGTGNNVNRFLIDGIAREGGGEADYVLLNSPGYEVGKKFYDRISSPVLTDVKVDFDGLEVKEVFPRELSDVWAEKPLYIKGRYLKPGAGTISLTGYAGGKPYKQDLKVVFPEKQSVNEVLKPMWARAKVERLMSEDWRGAQIGAINKELQEEIVKTALDYHILSQYTSFVAVEQKRVTKNGVAKTVAVPVEIPDGVSRSMTVAEDKISIGESRAFASSKPVIIDYRMAPQSFTAYGGGYGGVSRRIETNGPAGSGIPKAAPSSLASNTDAGRSKEKMIGSKVQSEAAKNESKSDSKDETASLQNKMDKALISLINARTKEEMNRISGVEISQGEVIVKLSLCDRSDSTLERLKALGLKVLDFETKSNTLTVRIKISKLEKLAADPSVIRLEPALSRK